MAKPAEQVLLDTFTQVAGTSSPSQLKDLIDGLIPRDAVGEASRQIDALRVASQTQSEAINSNTDAVSQNTAAHGAGGGGAASTIGRVASTVLSGGGLAAVPVVAAIASLFGGGQPAAPPPLPRYVAPSPLRIEEAASGGVISPADYGQNGLPRALPAPQITVQVQAIDSRSFLDHSHEIAQAVREAMLNMHSLNDVVSEL